MQTNHSSPSAQARDGLDKALRNAQEQVEAIGVTIKEKRTIDKKAFIAYAVAFTLIGVMIVYTFNSLMAR